MPIYLGTKKLKCGYFGTVPLKKTFFGSKLVCTACAEAFPEFPKPTATARFSMMIKSSTDLMPDWTTGAGVSSLIAASSNYVIPNWGLIAHGTDVDGNFDFELTCASTITMFQFVRNKSSILNIQVAKSVDHLDKPSNCKYYYTFNHLENLKTVQILPGTGEGTNYCRMFWDNKNLTYVDLPKTLFGDIKTDFDKMFYATPKLRFVSYLDTRHTISGGRIDMFLESAPIRPGLEEQSALMNTWGSRFQFNVCRMFDDDSWKKSDKTAFKYYLVTFNDKPHGGNHHSSATNVYAYTSEDGHDVIRDTNPEDLVVFHAWGTREGHLERYLRNNSSSYWKSFHWGNGSFDWEFKVPTAIDSFRIQVRTEPSYEMGRYFIIQGSNVSNAGPWTTVKEYRTTDDYGNFESMENRTILIDD